MRYLIVTTDRVYAHHLASLMRGCGDVADCRAQDMSPFTGAGCYLRDYGVDAVVLDLSDAGMVLAGNRLRAWRRAAGPDMPLMVLARRGCREDVSRFVAGGADGCHDRSEDARALLARLSALVRRRHGLCSDVLVLPPLRLDLRREVAWVHGEVVRLTQMEFRVLAILVRHRGRLMTRSDILLRLHGELPGDGHGHSLDVILGRLRRKVSEPLAEAGMCIRTHRGMGFVFELPAATRGALPAPARSRAPGRSTAPPGGVVSTRRRRNAVRAGWSWGPAREVMRA